MPHLRQNVHSLNNRAAGYDQYGKCIKAFVATLSYSRATFVRFTERERQENWIEGLQEAFEYFGGAPKEVLFDKAIMIERDAYGERLHR